MKLQLTPPRTDKATTTNVGFCRKMQYCYECTDTRNEKEYHRVYDFDFSYKTIDVDYVPFNGFFLALQRAEERFVAAYLMNNQRDCIAVITKQDRPKINSSSKRGLFFVHLAFGGGGYGGIPLAACDRETFTVRIVCADRAGTNFYLSIDGQHHQQQEVDAQRAKSFTFNIKPQSPQSLCVHNGRIYYKPFMTYEHVTNGPSNLRPLRNVNNKRPYEPIQRDQETRQKNQYETDMNELNNAFQRRQQLSYFRPIQTPHFPTATELSAGLSAGLSLTEE
jgi:hypothetical protein